MIPFSFKIQGAIRPLTAESGKRLHFRNSRSVSGFTLIELMIVVLIIGILLAIAVPNFVYTRETARKKSCVQNMWKIQLAKNSYIMDHNKPEDTPASELTDDVLYGATNYIQFKPNCPGGGTYSVNDGQQMPTCNYGGGGVHAIGVD